MVSESVGPRPDGAPDSATAVMEDGPTDAELVAHFEHDIFLGHAVYEGRVRDCPRSSRRTPSSTF